MLHPPKPYYCCRTCKTYARLGWPEFTRWFESHSRHQVFSMYGFEVPEGYKAIISPMDELARECREIEEEIGVVVCGHREGCFFPESRHLEAARGVPLRPAPRWLGNFSFRVWGGGTPDPVPFPVELADLVVQLQQQVASQQFNTVYLQRYDRGHQVLEHRDPKNNLGYTVIGTFGTWEGATTSVREPENLSFRMGAGDVAVLPCTLNGKQGPRHSVSRVTYGTRWALILGTTQS